MCHGLFAIVVYFAKYSVDNKFVRILCDVNCSGHSGVPYYRVFVNQELFGERTWIWPSENYLMEAIQLNAPAGMYQIKYELVPPAQGQIEMTNMRIDSGDARMLKRNTVEIY